MQVTIRDSGDLRRLNRLLREQADGKQVRKELNDALRGIVDPIRDEVKTAYRTQPEYKGRRSRPGPPLRQLLARATRVEIRTSGRLAGVRLRVDGRKMPAGMRSLPAYWEGYKRPWRHPVHGDRDTWVTQPARPVFDRTVEPHEEQAGRAVDEVLEATRRKLERR